MDFIKNEIKKPIFHYVLLLALLVAIVNYNFLSQLKQLPSPIYGGDFYNHLGSMYSIYYGGLSALFQNGQMIGEIQWVPWLYHLYVVILANISGMDPMFANIYSSLPLIFTSAIIIYLLVSKFTDNKILILAAVLLFLTNYPIYKYTPFAFYVTMPLMILAWIYFLEHKSLNRSLFLIAAIAIANLSSTQAFFSQLILFGVIILDLVYKKYKEQKSVDYFKSAVFIETIKPFALVIMVSFLLSLIYWYWPLFVYKGHTTNDLQIYGWPDFTKLDVQVSWFIGILSGAFFSFGSFQAIISSILNVLGVAGILLYRNKSSFHYSLFLVLVAAFISSSHHFILFNLIQTHLSPNHLFEMFQNTLMPLEVVIGLLFAIDKLKLSAIPNIQNLFGASLALFVIFIFATNLSAINNSQWIKVGQEPFPDLFLSAKSWILSNTGVNDVFITTNEDGFMLNGLTGRKVVSYRRTHAPVYTDMDQRMLDQAVILYGTNDQKRVELLKKYDVKYLFWSQKWITNEFAIGNEGKIAGFFDPLMVKDKPEYRKYLEDNGVQYMTTRYYLDPAWAPIYPTYDVLVALPSRGNIYEPWNEGLNQYLVVNQVIAIKDDNGQQVPFFVFYKINYK